MTHFIISLAAIATLVWPLPSAATPQLSTKGVHHVGLTVKNAAMAKEFFVDALGFKLVDARPDYPAFFVSDGTHLITLWQVSNPENAAEFDRKNVIGMHHLAFRVDSLDVLNAFYERLKNWPEVHIEFAPEKVGKGPAQHMIFRTPNGLRLELFTTP